MKKLLMLCLMAYATHAVAQEKSVNIDSLIESRSFALVINKIEKKPGFNGPVSHYTQTANFNQFNPSVSTPLQKANIIDIPVGAMGSNRVDEFYRLSQTDGSYYSAFNINPKLNAYSHIDSDVIFLIQDGNELKVTATKDPKNLNEIVNNDYLDFSKGNFQLETSKKNNNGYLLTYIFKQDKSKRKIYIDVDNKGNVAASGQPTKEFTTFFNGNLVGLK